MKKGRLIISLILLSVLGIVTIYREEVSKYVVNNWIYNRDKTINIDKNEYSLGIDYNFVQITNDFNAKSYNHLINIIYTILDSGEQTFYFYCDDSYKSCMDDVKKLINEDPDTSILSDLNNFVHPFNTYEEIIMKYNNLGKVTITIEKQYSEEEIKLVLEYVKKIEEQIWTKEMSSDKKIKAAHDYLINNTKYDKERADNMNDPKYLGSTTHKAYGLFTTHYALCGGYSDSMALFLYDIGIPNIRISADNHVWNLVNLDDKWLHLDVTWDDPYTGKNDILIIDYYLVDNNKLFKADTMEHNYNKDIYFEATN